MVLLIPKSQVPDTHNEHPKMNGLVVYSKKAPCTNNAHIHRQRVKCMIVVWISSLLHAYAASIIHNVQSETTMPQAPRLGKNDPSTARSQGHTAAYPAVLNQPVIFYARKAYGAASIANDGRA